MIEIMIQNMIHDAKKKFFENYNSKISDLGYDLSVGLGWDFADSKNFDAIQARVTSQQPISEDSKIFIESIIPKKYFYNGKFFTVKLSYPSIVKMTYLK